MTVKEIAVKLGFDGINCYNDGSGTNRMLF